MSDRGRALMGFLFGFVILYAVVQVFQVNRFDFDNMQRGVRLIWQGVNPWAAETRIPHFYNPPFASLFLWPMLFFSPKVMLVLGGALCFALVFYQRAWVGLAFFATNSFLYLIAAGGIDLFVVGGGLLLLLAGDRLFERKLGLMLRVLAYGLLLVKPQGTIFIVGLYLLLRMDWKGGLMALAVYGLPFFQLYPDWLRVLVTDPPLAQTEAAHTIMGKFGPWAAILIAVLVLASRRWRFWQLGGALAGILSPYGMPGLPIFLVYTAVSNLAAIPAIVIYSACLAAVTWVSPPFPVPNFYDYVNPLMSIYHLGMLGLALILACMFGMSEKETDELIDAREVLSVRLHNLLMQLPIPRRSG